MTGSIIFTSYSNPGIAVISLGYLERYVFSHFLDGFAVKTASNQPFDGKQCAVRIGNSLAFRRLADEHFTVVTFRKAHHGRCRPRTFRILDDLAITALHQCDARVGGTKIDANYFTHFHYPPLADQKQPLKHRRDPQLSMNYTQSRCAVAHGWYIGST